MPCVCVRLCMWWVWALKEGQWEDERQNLKKKKQKLGQSWDREIASVLYGKVKRIITEVWETPFPSWVNFSSPLVPLTNPLVLSLPPFLPLRVLSSLLTAPLQIRFPFGFLNLLVFLICRGFTSDTSGLPLPAESALHLLSLFAPFLSLRPINSVWGRRYVTVDSRTRIKALTR